MDNENKGFPNGWGDNSEDDDDYGFVDDTDKDDEDSAWGNSSSPFKKNEPVTYPETNNKTSTQSESVTPNTSNESNNDSVYDAPVQNFEQPESISPPAPTLNFSPNQGGVIQKQKTSPFLIIVIIVLVLIVGILGGMFFMMRKDKKSGTSDEISAVSDAAETTAEITEAPTESKIKTTTVTVPVEPTTKDRTDIDQNKIKEAYIRKLTEFAESDDFNAYEYASKYALYDIDNDGIEELIIQYQSVVGNAENLYYYKNGEYEIIAQCGESSFSICPEEHCVQWYGYGGYELRSILSIEKQGNSIDELHTESYPNTVYIYNNVGISKSEYEDIMAKYDAMNWISPTFYTFNTILSDDIIYAKPQEHDQFLAVVDTESTELNVRESPNADSKILGTIPKGAYVTAAYIDGYTDWYKVEYSEKNIKGYASAKYIKEYNGSSNNNDTPYVSGMQTPWGTFTYSNFSESDYDSYTIYDPASVGIYLNCDIDSFNSNHSDYRIDNIAFWIVKYSTENKPHNYDMGITIMGTVLSENKRNINIKAYLINESTGEKIGGNVEMRLKTNLYSGETFCFDSISYNMWETFSDIWDNSSYTLVLE